MTKLNWAFDRGLFLILALMLTSNLLAQEKKTISGTVKDKIGMTMPGVYVIIKNTSTGTITNAEGNFSIAVPNMQAVVVFSSIGYKSIENIALNVNGKTMVMEESEATKIDEVVVIGYGTAKRKDLTGSVGKVDMESMARAPVANFDQALAGRIAGVVVTSNDGQPGAASQITIRGGSVTQDATPLYILDGFPIENLDVNSINPNDIETFDVLKDASSIAIYGARGANGVIIINTKRGVAGKPRITYSYSASVQHDTRRVKLMDPYQFVKLQLDIDSVASTPTNTVTRFHNTYLDPANGITLDSYRNEAGYDWQDLLLKPGSVQNHSINITGGTIDTRYNLSGSIFDQKGIIINTGMKRYDGSLSLDQRLNNNLKFGLSAKYSNTKTYGTIPSSGQGGGVVEGMWKYRPVTGVKNQDLLNSAIDSTAFADFNNGTTQTLGDNSVNPLLQAQNEYRVSTNVTGYLNAFLEYTFLKNFRLKISGGYNTANSKREQFYNSNTQQGNLFKNTSGSYVNTNGINGSFGTALVQSYLNENTLSYRNEIVKGQILDAVVGFTYQTASSQTYSFGVINIPQANEYLLLNSFSAGTPVSGFGSKTLWQMYSFLGRVNYTIKNKYLFTGTLRSDGSSKFAPGNQWGYFPSGAFAWRFTSEPFMKKILSFINDGKFRLSYGSVGNNRVNDFAYLSQFGALQTSVGYPYNNVYQTGIQPYFTANNSVTWETTKEVDLGLDLTLFDERINITADYYSKKTTNFLLSVTLPKFSGYGSTTQYQNTGNIMNRGLELTLNTYNVKSKNFQWISSLNISFNKGKILDFYNGFEVKQTNTGMYGSPAGWIAKVGGPIAEFYGYQWGGCFQYADFDKLANGSFVLKNGIPTYSPNVQPGDAKYIDINGDGKIDVSDMTVIGHPLPIHTGGFNNNFIYKNLSLNVFLQWSYGNDILNANQYMFNQFGSYFAYGNQFASYADRWTPTNPSDDIPRLRNNTKQDIDNVSRISSRLIEDGSFIRLKTVSLSYTLPQKFIKKLKVQNIKLTASAQNLFTLTKYKGIDPEVSNFRSMNPAGSPWGSSGSSSAVAAANMGSGYSYVQPSSSYTALSPGYDYAPYPRTVTYNFGFNVTF
jgi:TonB-linked SusC/RagA family outer membrane protein